MTLKPGAEERMRSTVAEFERLKVPGFKGQLVYRSDSDPNELFLAVVFESKEAYQANARSPEQHQRYQGYRELLAVDPEWHDGEIVYANM
jgi:heme-degrading monooxygenase HmoA